MKPVEIRCWDDQDDLRVYTFYPDAPEKERATFEWLFKGEGSPIRSGFMSWVNTLPELVNELAYRPTITHFINEIPL